MTTYYESILNEIEGSDGFLDLTSREQRTLFLGIKDEITLQIANDETDPVVIAANVLAIIEVDATLGPLVTTVDDSITPVIEYMANQQLGNEVAMSLADRVTLLEKTGEVSGEGIGMKSWLEDNSFSNTAALNAYLSALGSGTSPSNRKKLVLNGGPYHFSTRLNDSTVLQTNSRTGGSIEGHGGLSPELGEAHYSWDGGTTRLAYDGPYVPGLAFLTVLAQGPRLTDITLQGYASNSYADFPPNYANFLDYGIYIPSSVPPYGLGDTRGKNHGINLGFGGFKTAIRQGTIGGSGVGEHSDYFTYPGHIWAGACGTVFHSSTVQNVVNRIGTLHCQGCGRGLYLEAGGINMIVDNLYFGEIVASIPYITPRAVIEIGGTPYSYNANKLQIGFIHIDGSTSKTPILLCNGPGAGGTGSDIISIFGGSIPPTYGLTWNGSAFVDSLQGGAAAFTLRGGRTYNFYNLSYLQEGMFAVRSEGNGPPIINLFGCTMGPKVNDTGAVIGYHDPTLLVSNAKSDALGGDGVAEINHFATNRFGNGAAYSGARTLNTRHNFSGGLLV